ncbi:RPL27A [Symbiodinium sp. CCMP2456]|nr:RPL27A [Symbiodinium sp. CCMP2456]
MGRFIKAGRVVVMLQGRYAGKKAIVVKTFDDGSKARSFGHALVAGIDRAPLKVTRRMSKKKITKRTKVKPFVKYVNYNHIMPTRYNVPAEISPSTICTDQQMDTPDGRKEARKFAKSTSASGGARVKEPELKNMCTHTYERLLLFVSIPCSLETRQLLALFGPNSL